MSLLKKTCSIILAVTLVLTLFACVAFCSASAVESGPALAVEEVEVETDATTAAVDVNFVADAGNPVKGFQFVVNYAADLTPATPAFDFDDSVYEVYNTAFDTDKHQMAFVVFSESDIASASLTLNFTLPAELEGGEEYAITLSDVVFSVGTPVAGTTTDGKITVKENQSEILYGDVNNDGKIDFTDYVNLKLYVIWNGSEEYQLANIQAADVATDGKIDFSDYVRLKLYVIWNGSEEYPLGPTAD